LNLEYATSEQARKDLLDRFAIAALPLAYKWVMEDYYHRDAKDAKGRNIGHRDDFDEEMPLIAGYAYDMAEEMLRRRNEGPM
jgi:hypothetical protein